MAQSAASMASLMKDMWTSEKIQDQFESENRPLKKFKAVKGTMIGTQAQVPIHNNRSGSYTTVGAAGGSLNGALAQQVSQALYTLVYSWFQIELETSALAQTGGPSQSVIAAKDLEINGAVENTAHQMTRQIVTNGDSKVAACGTASSSTTVPLTAAASEGAAYGYSSLIRGWLFPNMPVDIGTTGDTDALVTASTISAIDTTATAPTITIGSAIAPTAGTHFVYIPNPNSATAANPEMNGLRLIVNTGALGGLNPATAGQEFWAPALRDTTTSVLSLDLILNLQRGVLQNSNTAGQEIWFGYKQQANYYSLLQNQVRFAGEGSLAAGNVAGATWNGMSPQAYADILDTDVFLLTLSDLVKITGNYDGPKWASDVAGGNMAWKQGTTSYVDGLNYPLNIGCQRRNTHAAATALVA